MDDKMLIDRMRSRYSAELAEAESRTKAIRAKLQVLDDLVAEKDQLALADQSGKSPKAQIFSPNTKVTLQAPNGLTDACFWAVETFGKASAVSPKDVRNVMVQHGFVPNGKNFSAVVMNTLKRLAVQGRIRQEKHGKNLFFSPKEAP